jgi:hypothetical protein
LGFGFCPKIGFIHLSVFKFKKRGKKLLENYKKKKKLSMGYIPVTKKVNLSIDYILVTKKVNLIIHDDVNL